MPKIETRKLNEVRGSGATFGAIGSNSDQEGLQTLVTRQNVTPADNQLDDDTKSLVQSFVNGEALQVAPDPSGLPGRIGVFTPSQLRINDDQLQTVDTLETAGLVVRERTNGKGYSLRHKDHVGKPLPALATPETGLLSEAAHKKAVTDRHSDKIDPLTELYTDDFINDYNLGRIKSPRRDNRRLDGRLNLK